MIERLWQGEAEQFLDARFRALGEEIGQPVPLSGLRIGPPLAVEEAKYFLLGLEAELFELDADGAVDTSLMKLRDAEAPGQQKLRMFSYDRPPLRLIRRSVCVVSTAAALILARGWLQQQIELEPPPNDADAATSGADIIIKSLGGKLLAAIAVKRTEPEVEKFRSDLRQCCRRGRHALDNCGFPQNHASFEYCAANRPHYLGVISPDREMSFQLTYCEDGAIQLDEFASLPPRSIIEMRDADSE